MWVKPQEDRKSFENEPDTETVVCKVWVRIHTLNLINLMHAKTASRGFKQDERLKIFSVLMAITHHVENQETSY